MEQNIKVFCRIRPLEALENEDENGQHFHVSNDATELTIVTKNSVKMELQFKFDHIFQGGSSQRNVYQKVMHPIVAEVIAGFNATIFAYGQTGSGKTHSIIGSADKTDIEHLGLMPRASKNLIELLQKSRDQDKRQFLLECAFVEVYQEKLRDLLVKGHPPEQKLEIKSRKKGSVYIKNLTYQPVENLGDVLRLMSVSRARRVTCATFMNTHSSRSHWLAILRVTQTFADATVQISKLNFVDLAGSEKVSKSGATGNTLEEAKLINKSLLMLGQVINALATKAPHVPYRDSKLTHVLKDSLGGNTKTTLLVTISPQISCHNETISTLRFGSRAQQIITRASINRRLSRQELERVIKNLEKQLSNVQSQQGSPLLSPSRSSDLQSEVDELRAIILRLETSLTAKNKELQSLRNEKVTLKEKVKQNEKATEQNKVLSKRKTELERRVVSLTERVSSQSQNMSRMLQNQSATRQIQSGVKSFVGMQERSHGMFERLMENTEKHERGLQHILSQQQQMFASIVSCQQEILSQISQQSVVLQSFQGQFQPDAMGRVSSFLEQSHTSSTPTNSRSPSIHMEDTPEINCEHDEKRECVVENAITAGDFSQISSISRGLVLSPVEEISTPENASSDGFKSPRSDSSASEFGPRSSISSNFSFSPDRNSIAQLSVVESVEDVDDEPRSSLVVSCATIVACAGDRVIISSDVICDNYFQGPSGPEEFSLSDMSRSLQLSMKRPKRKMFRWVLFARRRRVKEARKSGLKTNSPRPKTFQRKHAVDLSFDRHVTPYSFLMTAPH